MGASECACWLVALDSYKTAEDRWSATELQCTPAEVPHAFGQIDAVFFSTISDFRLDTRRKVK